MADFITFKDNKKLNTSSFGNTTIQQNNIIL